MSGSADQDRTVVNRTPQQVVVVGGGIVGAMCGWYLLQGGCRVTIVERDRFGQGCSHGNCGFIAPSHVLPLPRPGAIRDAIGSMFHRYPALRISLRCPPRRLHWLWQFARHCRRATMLQSARGLHELLQSSRALYGELILEQGLDCQWQSRGLVYVYDRASEFEQFAETDKLLREEFGVGATPYQAKELVELEPALKPEAVAGGWHYEIDSHLRPDRLLEELRRCLQQHGATIVENFSVERVIRERGLARAVVSAEGEIAADQFVFATGAWTPFLKRELGCRIPIEPGKGYSLTMPQPDPMPRIPLIFHDSHVAVTPLNTKYRLGSTMEFAGYDSSLRPARLTMLKRAAEKYLLDPHCEPVEETWYGWRPMTWDGKPIIDRSPELDNVWLATGHNMLGMSLAPGTGRLLREMILGDRPHVDPSHFAVSRFNR